MNGRLSDNAVTLTPTLHVVLRPHRRFKNQVPNKSTTQVNADTYVHTYVHMLCDCKLLPLIIMYVQHQSRGRKEPISRKADMSTIQLTATIVQEVYHKQQDFQFGGRE